MLLDERGGRLRGPVKPELHEQVRGTCVLAAQCVSGKGLDQPFTGVASLHSLAERREWLSYDESGLDSFTSRAQIQFRRRGCLDGPFLPLMSALLRMT